QVFPGIRNKLYYEKNLLFLMTMPFEPMEVVMAKYLQILPLAYRIMGLMVLPVWLGVGTTIHFERGLNTAVLVACLVIPLFEMLLIFILVMLWQIYIRKLVRQSPAIAIVVPVVLLLVVMIVIVLLEIMFPGQILSRMARALGNILIFNFAWEMMIQGSLLLPLLFVAVSCVLVGMIFSMVTKQIYRKSLLSRWDLAGDDGSGNQSFDKMLTRHSQGWSLFLRELRTIRGSRFFAIPLFVSCFLVPVLVLLFFALLTWLLPAFSLQAEKNALETGSILIGFVSAQTLVAGVMNWVAATAWSRDAHVRVLLYVMPLESDQLLKAKLAAGCCYGALGSTPYVLLACIWLLVHKHMPIWGLPLALSVNVCFVIMTTSIGMIREIFHPNLTWKEARELVDRKGNLGFLIGIVASILFPVLFGLLFRYSKGSAFSELVFFLFLLLLLTALAVLFLMSMDLKKVCRPEIAEIKKERKPLNFLKKIKSRVDTKRKNIV
ncbi:MAG: hypothetical protein MJ117_02890, partial [Lachnospiraceae bacterium]|nr:hypothetical protein [Lachnospiraceae bacterium]